MKERGIAKSTAQKHVRKAAKELHAQAVTQVKEAKEKMDTAAKEAQPAREFLKQELGEKYWGNKDVQPYYRPGANPTVDNVITRDGKDEKEVLMIQRKAGTAEGERWALPGGFHDTDAKKGEPWKEGRETAQEAAVRELAEETGLDAKHLAANLQAVGTYEGNGRDPRDNDEAWSKSNAFKMHLSKEMAEKSVVGTDDAQDAKWIPVSQLGSMKLAFDHGKILKDALK